MNWWGGVVAAGTATHPTSAWACLGVPGRAWTCAWSGCYQRGL